MHTHTLQLFRLPLNVPHRKQGYSCDGNYKDDLDVLESEVKTTYLVLEAHIDNTEQIDCKEEKISRDFDCSYDAFPSFDPVKDTLRVSHESWLEESCVAHVMNGKLPVQALPVESTGCQDNKDRVFEPLRLSDADPAEINWGA